MKKFHLNFGFCLALAGLCILPGARAANKAWSTSAPGPANGNFSGINWTVGTTGAATPTSAAASGDALFFDTSAITTLTNDLSGATFAGITFNLGASAYTIGGNAFTLSGNLTNNSSSLQTFSNNITFAAAQTVAATGNISLSGNLGGAGTSLTKTGAGTLSLSGATNSTSGTLLLGAGQLNVTAGTTNFGGGFSNLGNTASTAAVVGVSSGATFGLTGANGGNFGTASGASMALYNAGTFNQSATTLNNAGIYLGNTANAYGYLQNSPGATTTIGGRLWIAQAANATGAAGVLDITGGTVSVNPTANFNSNQRLQINGDNTTHTTTSYAGVNITGGGTLTVGGNAQTNINTGQNEYSSINITGTGSKWTAGTSGLDAGIGLGTTSIATNTATLSISNGGTLETSYIYNNNALGTGVITFDNGTIRSLFNNSTGIIQGSNTKTYIESGGVTFDTNGFATIVQNPLLAVSGSGVTSITLAGTTTGYIGAPIVKITGGGGQGAAAIANFDPTTGTVTSITVTSAGSGYTSAPIITLVGGNGGATGAGTGTATATATVTAVNSGGLTKTGSGSLILTRANTYTGSTTVNVGTLSLDFSQSGAPSTNILSSSSALNLGGGTLSLTGKASTTNSQTVAGLTLNSGGSAITLTANATANPLLLTLGAITQNPGGTVNFTLPTGTQGTTNGITTITANTATSILGGWATVAGTDWAVSAGTGSVAGNITALSTYKLYDNVGGWLGNGVPNTDLSDSNGFDNTTSNSITINSLRFNAANSDSNINMNGGNNLTISSGGILVTANAGSTGKYQRINGGGLTTAGADLVINQYGTSGHLEIGSSIFGSINLVKAGSGFLDLTNLTASYSGSTTINGGTLQLSGADNMLPTSTAVTINNGTLILNGRNQSIAGLSGSALATVDHVGASTTLTDTQTTTTTFAGVMKNTTNSLSFAKTGSGTLTLSGLNTYSGGTSLTGGTLKLGVTNALPSTAGSLAVSGATFDLNGFSQTVVGFNGNSLTTGIVTNSSSTAGTFTLNDTGVDVYSGQITGSLALVKSGSGTLTLNNSSSSYTGGVTINSGGTITNGLFPGRLIINNDTDLGVAPGSFNAAAVTIDGATLGVATTTTINANRGITITTNGGAISDLQAAGTQNLTISSAVVNNSGANHLFLESSDATTFNGVMSGAGDIVKEGAGTVSLNAGNTFQGSALTGQLYTSANLYVDNGTAQTNNATGFGTTTSNATGAIGLGAQFNNAQAGNATLVNTGNVTVANPIDVRYFGFATTKTIASNVGSGAATFSGAITLHDTVTLNAQGAGDLTMSGAIAPGLTGASNGLGGSETVNGTPGLTIASTGAGKVNLTGSNTYAGATTVNAGTLALGNAGTVGGANGGTLANTSQVTVNSTGTLLLNASNAIGTATPMTLNGGTFNANSRSDGLSNGSSAPTPGIGALTLSANSTIDFGSGSTASAVAFSDSHSIAWTGTLTIMDWNGTVGVADAPSGKDALFFGTSSAALTSTQLGEIKFNIGGNLYGAQIASNGEVFAAVPEPTTVFGALALLGMVGYRERRRVKSIGVWLAGHNA